MPQAPYDVVLLDHDLGGRQMEDHEDCGLTFVKLIKDRLPLDQWVGIHSLNPGGAERMAQEIPNHQVAIVPFGSAGFKRLLYMARRQAA